MNLRDYMDYRISKMNDKTHQDDIDSCITDILKMIEKRVEDIIDYTNVGECPECDKNALKKFKEMLRWI